MRGGRSGEKEDVDEAIVAVERNGKKRANLSGEDGRVKETEQR